MAKENYLNHADKGSNEENLEIIFLQSSPGSRWSEAVFFSSRQIMKGEELAYDYCFFGHGEQFEFNQEYFKKCSNIGLE